MEFPVIIVAKKLYFLMNSRSAHPVMNAMNVAILFFWKNSRSLVDVAIAAAVVDGGLLLMYKHDGCGD